MADPVRILTPAGPMTLALTSAQWIYDQFVNDDALYETRRVLDESMRGVEVALPEAEREAFCSTLQEILAGMSPAELSSLQPQEAALLLAAVCV
jgi:hypothetical protein